MGRSGCHVIDAHHHVGSVPSLMAQVADSGPRGLELDLGTFHDPAEVAERISVMDANGIDQAVVIPTHEYLRPAGVADTRRVNDAIAGYRDRHPGRFPAAVGIVEPLYGRCAFDELQRVNDELGLVGISFHTRFQGVSTDSYLVRGLVEREVFGTDMYSPPLAYRRSTVLDQLVDSGLDDEQTSLILSGNLRRILSLGPDAGI